MMQISALPPWHDQGLSQIHQLQYTTSLPSPSSFPSTSKNQRTTFHCVSSSSLAWKSLSIHPYPLTSMNTSVTWPPNEVPRRPSVLPLYTVPINTCAKPVQHHENQPKNQPEDKNQQTTASLAESRMIPSKHMEMEIQSVKISSPHCIPSNVPSINQNNAYNTELTSSFSSLSSSSSSYYTDLTVSGYSIRPSNRRVLYHIDVQANQSHLETYTIRRSYSDFKSLYHELMDVLNNERYARKQPRHGKEVDTRTNLQNNNCNDDKNQDEEVMASLPPLPSAGFVSYWRRHDRFHLQHRCDMFQLIIDAIMKISILRNSYALQQFLSVAPSTIRTRGSSYVSLCEYSVPYVDPKEEYQERKQRALACKRRNSSANATLILV